MDIVSPTTTETYRPHLLIRTDSTASTSEPNTPTPSLFSMASTGSSPDLNSSSSFTTQRQLSVIHEFTDINSSVKIDIATEEATPAANESPSYLTKAAHLVSQAYHKVNRMIEQNPLIGRLAMNVAGTFIGGTLVWATYYRNSTCS